MGMGTQPPRVGIAFRVPSKNCRFNFHARRRGDGEPKLQRPLRGADTPDFSGVNFDGEKDKNARLEPGKNKVETPVHFIPETADGNNDGTKYDQCLPTGERPVEQ
jgi:hypothetical protein